MELQRLSLWATGNLDHAEKAGGCRDVDDDYVHRSLTEWLSAWKRGQFPRTSGNGSSKVHLRDDTQSEERRTGGSEPRSPTESPTEERRAGGTSRAMTLPRMLRAHDRSGNLTESIPRSERAVRHLRVSKAPTGVDGFERPVDNVQEAIDEWLGQRLRSDLAPNTEKLYARHWRRWTWWRQRRGLPMYLDSDDPSQRREDENE
eukprot:2824150-Amphidinium_carterae.1